MRKITATGIFLEDHKIHSDKALVLDDEGRILDVVDCSTLDDADLEQHDGLLTPGFINTHCHLELSHMKGKVHTGTGLLPFIESVVKTRGATNEEIQEAIEAGHREMADTGIVAVGDISNQKDTFRVKSASKDIRYHTFIECFDFMQESNAQSIFDGYASVNQALDTSNGNTKTFSPHAPYSMSDTLYRLILDHNPDDCTISIHNQETPPENEFFLTKTGGFIDFYRSFQIGLDDFEATGQTSIHSCFHGLNPANRNLFVHNTLSTVEDIRAAQAFSPNTFWATCPNANLYIENRLPNYQNFLDTDAMVTIGTDSLTSNWQLNLLEEIKTIKRYQSYVPVETLLKWATINGAQALGYDESIGSFTKGKQPGVVLIRGIRGETIDANATSKRLI